MGFRSQFESLVGFHARRRNEADVYMVYGREAFPRESRWPAPVPDGRPVADPETLVERFEVVRRFAREIGDQVPFLVDDLSNGMMTAYDAYPFRVFAIAPDGTVAVTSDKGAAGFGPTLERTDAWLTGRSGETAEGKPIMERPSETTTVFDFSADAEIWPSIDDRVMGGISRSRMTLDGGLAIFEGIVSLENNGGFASLRSPPAEHELEGHGGLVVRLRGDGKTYGLRLRTNTRFDGVSYQAEVVTEAGQWIEVRLPFDAFRPVFRGREVGGHPALDPGAIRTFGLIISDKQEGPFRLELDWIAAYRDE